MQKSVVKTSCQACHCECGVLVHRRENEIMKIEGDPLHPMSRGMLCPKGLAYRQLLYHPDRLKYPLKRDGKRGEGKWRRITWDEALDLMADQFMKIADQYDPEAICGSYGTQPRGNSFSTALLLNALGSPNLTSIGHICFLPSKMIESITVGHFITAEIGPDYQNSKCILVWGANPPITHPPRGRDILESWENGAKLIVVDPRFTDLASRADLWLRIKPGTDGALAMGMLYVIIKEGLYDKEFVENWCIGFEHLRKRVEQYPPQKVSQWTWIPEDKIVKAARMYATIKPASLHHRVSVEMHTRGFQTLRSQIILVAITGNIDVAGGNLLPQPPKNFVTVDQIGRSLSLSKETKQKRIGGEKFPLFSGSDSLVQRAHYPSVIKAMLTKKPYPIKGLFTVNNMIINGENTKEVWEALNQLDFSVCVDFFMTPTAELGDLVLPAATWLEKDEICEHSFTNFISVRQRVIDPLYECWDDKKIVFEFIKKLGKSDQYPWKNVEEFNHFRLKPMGLTFQDFQNQAYIIEPIVYKKYEAEGFKTPSGKVELYSTILEKYGYDPLPSYHEGYQEGESSPNLEKEFPYIFLNGAKKSVFFHSENRQIPWLREICPDPEVEIHPETAQRHSIKDADWVLIESPYGKIKQKAKLTLGIDPNLVHASHGWWFPEKEGPEHGCLESNVNVLISNDSPYDPVTGATPTRVGQCRITKIELPENPG